MKASFHVHTNKSIDSLITPKDLLRFAEKNNLDAIFVTDHETIAGSLIIQEYFEQSGSKTQVILGAEYKTDVGDMIGVFLKKEVKERTYREFIVNVKEQGGVVILPHPFKYRTKIPIDDFTGIDYIETFNSRTTDQEDKLAKKLARDKICAQIAGSDAHFKGELGNCYITFDSLDDFRKGRIYLSINGRSKKRDLDLSNFVKGLRTKRPIFASKNFAKFVLHLISRR